MKKLILPFIIIAFIACTNKKITVNEYFKQNGLQLADPDATEETKALFMNLREISRNFILLGHEDAVAYGIGWWEKKGESDVKDACNSYPAIFGWDVAPIGEERNIDSVSFENMRKWTIEAFKRGAINTVSWHTYDPVTKEKSWVSRGDTSTLVTDVLPGGSKHIAYVEKLDLLADYFLSLKTEKNILAPIIFRPFHEHNGEWFWWGSIHCTNDEYLHLWRFTVEYLRDTKNVHNLLYAISPDASRMYNRNEEEYLFRYPGDDYVDILGIDNYWDVRRVDNKTPYPEQEYYFLSGLRTVVQLANQKGKIAALTETGLIDLTSDKWFTEVILNPIKYDPIANKIAYILIWRNYPNALFIPYMGHSKFKNFQDFCNDPIIILEDDLPDMYLPYIHE